MRMSWLGVLFLGTLLFIQLGNSTTGQDIVFPELKVPEVMPEKKTEPVTTLPAGQLYVVTSSQPLLIIESPVNGVLIDSKKGPVTLGGKFVDGVPDFEWRDYSATQWVYVIRGAKKGKVELVFAKELDRKSVTRKTLDVTGSEDIPVPPEPKDDRTQFEKDVQASYDKHDKEEKELLPKLTEVYSETKSKLDKIETWVVLFQTMNKLNEEKELVGKLKEVKGVVQKKMASKFPSGDLSPALKITSAEKVDVTKTLEEIITALKKVKS